MYRTVTEVEPKEMTKTDSFYTFFRQRNNTSMRN